MASTTDAPLNLLDNRAADAQVFAQSGAVSAKIAEQTPDTQTDTAAPAEVAPAEVTSSETALSKGAPTEVAPAEVAPAEVALNGQLSLGKSSDAIALDEQMTLGNGVKTGVSRSDGLGETRTQSNPLVAQPRPDADGELPRATPYKSLPDGEAEPRIVELPPPAFDVGSGYWVSARRLRVFPRDEIQFERASIFYNGGRAFKAPALRFAARWLVQSNDRFVRF